MIGFHLFRTSPAQARLARTAMKRQTFALGIEQLEAKQLLSLSVYADKEIRSFMNQALVDRRIDRDELVHVFRLAGDHGGVSQNEFNDLGRILSNPSITQHDRYVASSILRSAANKGSDLKPNSSTEELNRLIDKHMLGKDLPAVSFAYAAYRPISGQLFVNGPSAADVKQGKVGDCYLVASFAAIADKDPQTITDRFIENGDGTWTVSFFSTNSRGSKDPHYVVVNNMLPVDVRTNRPIYASFGTTWNNPRNELWVGLLEKAYVQWNETGLTLQGNTLNAYSAISGGATRNAFNQLYSYHSSTIERITTRLPLSETKLINALRDGAPVSASRLGHAYYVSSYTQGKFVLMNPWGHSHLQFTFQEMITSVGRVNGITIGPIARGQRIATSTAPTTIRMEKPITSDLGSVAFAVASNTSAFSNLSLDASSSTRVLSVRMVNRTST